VAAGVSPVVHLLCAGAAKGVIEALRDDFAAEAGAAIDATFGAVGAIRERLDAGAPCDVIVLTAAMIDALAVAGRVRAATAAPLGRVRTGVAVRDSDPRPDIGDATALRMAFAQARAINVRPELLERLIRTDTHPVARLRVNGTVSNMPQFAAAFQCKAGDPLVRNDRCRVW